LRRILVIAGAIAALAIGSGIMGRRPLVDREQVATSRSRRSSMVRPEPPPLGEPLDVPVPLVLREAVWGIYPALGDIDGDGRADLLVGGGKGRMQFFRNVGAATRPEFAPPAWFDELCPNGRIPTG
jgi:hypothetical protein